MKLADVDRDRSATPINTYSTRWPSKRIRYRHRLHRQKVFKVSLMERLAIQNLAMRCDSLRRPIWHHGLESQSAASATRLSGWKLAAWSIVTASAVAGELFDRLVGPRSNSRGGVVAVSRCLI